LVLSDKYIAGFLDGDGSITAAQGKYLWLEFYQQLDNDGVIELISQRFPGGGLHRKRGKRRGTVTHARRLVYTGQRAVDMLCRLKPYLVTKRVRANRLLCELGFTERVGTDSMPVYPARKWLAGYFDADGCIYGGLCRGGSSAAIRLTINTDAVERDGIELVHKAFGGTLRSRGTGNCWNWELCVDAAKIKAVLRPFAQHLLLKKEQAYFILGCADMGHFRDGAMISEILKVMKTHPHRLSDLAAEVDVSAALAQVRDLQPAPGVRYRFIPGQTCRVCEKTTLYANGLCKNCWQMARYYASSQPSRRNNVVDPILRSKRQSESATA
jgi:hypothetical protein